MATMSTHRLTSEKPLRRTSATKGVGAAPHVTNPFLEPTDANLDLSFLGTDDDYLVYAVEHYERMRMLREGVVFDYLHRRERSEILWSQLVAAAAENFCPHEWMLPPDELKTPGLINGFVDYHPITDTSPEIYDREKRERMNANGQRPWLIMTTLNSGRHSSASFLHWVEDRLVPSILKSAREMAALHFRQTEVVVAPISRAKGTIKNRIRPPSPRTEPACEELTIKRLRRKLQALACHRIRHSAKPGESMTRTLARYRDALPPGVSDPVTLDGFIRRVDLVSEKARGEWARRLGDSRRLRAALESGRIHLVT